MGKRVLLAEDESDIAQLVGLHLSDAGLHVEHKSRGDDALTAALANDFDLMILDLRLPGMSGLDVCRQLRNEGSELPIVMLTAKTSELDRVLGLELGADDYVSKPFSAVELTARVKAVLRRSDLSDKHKQQAQKPEQIQCGALTINARTHIVSMGDDEIELTAKEFELLMHFASHPGEVFKRSELLDQVWGYGHDGYEHTVNSHINRLRAKIEANPAKPSQIITVWGVGYKFTPSTATS